MMLSYHRFTPSVSAMRAAGTLGRVVSVKHFRFTRNICRGLGPVQYLSGDFTHNDEATSLQSHG